MKNNNLSQEILGKIKKENISPRAKWRFLFKDYVIWSVGILALVIGALSFSVIIYLLRFSDWGVYSQAGNSVIEFIVLTLPYFWLVFLALFVYIIYYNIKHTKRGYKYSLPMIIVSSLLGSIILGGIFFQLGWAQKIDDVLGERAPLYTRVINHQMDFWDNPEAGRLVGVITEKVDDNMVILVDPKRDSYLVRVDSSITKDAIILETGQFVRLAGELTGDGEFRADIVAPARSGRGFFLRHGGHIPPEVRAEMIRDRHECANRLKQDCLRDRGIR